MRTEWPWTDSPSLFNSCYLVEKAIHAGSNCVLTYWEGSGRLRGNKKECESPLKWLRKGSLSLANNQEAPGLILLDFYHPGQLLLRFLIAILKACSTLSRSDFLLKGKWSLGRASEYWTAAAPSKWDIEPGSISQTGFQLIFTELQPRLLLHVFTGRTHHHPDPPPPQPDLTETPEHIKGIPFISVLLWIKPWLYFWRECW